ncbi:MAG: RHS repeat-associated core domain-containing protein [Verrucomicrobiota bacterium]
MATSVASASPDALVDGVTLNSGRSNNCGAVALHQLIVALKGATADTKIIDAAPVPANGFSMTELLALSAKAGLDLVAVQRPAGGSIPVPSLMHWKQGHYSAIVDQREGFYKVFDPSFPSQWLGDGTILKESSGDFIVKQDRITATWRRLARSQTDRIRGGVVVWLPAYCDTNDTPPCQADCSSCPTGGDEPMAMAAPSSGMATWRVSEPYINLWLMDEPLGYNPGLGSRISFQLAYKQRETLAGTNPAVFSCGQMWNCSWISYVIAPSITPPPGPPMTLVLPDGGERGYTADGATPEYYSRSVMSVTTTNGGTLAGCTVVYPDGASDSYNDVFTAPSGDVLCFRTAQTDPAGHSTQFIYTNSSTNIVLIYVVDTDGRTNTLGYTNTSYPNQITGVTDPFGRSTTLEYDIAGFLTNITDVMNLASAFTYGANQWITSLSTPYGTTTFSLTDNKMSTNDAIDRAVLVVDPMGGKNLFVSRHEASFLSGTTYTVPNEPAGAPSISSSTMTYLNSWHWGPMQFPQLSTTNMYSFTAADYLKGRQRNWLAGSASLAFSDALNMEQAVSPDGSTPGQQKWRAYDGESGYQQGTNALPAVLAWILPDGNSYYQWTQRNGWGNPTEVQEVWSQTFRGLSLTRIKQYFYAANGIDLMQQLGPLNETVAGSSYDTHHNVLTATNAVGDVTTYTYDTESRLTSVTTPAGLTTTNIYFSSTGYTNWIQWRIDLQISRTNSYFYANDLVVSHTNELGLVVRQTWDNLQRLTSTTFLDGTYTTNIYVNLDLVETIDRLGNQTKYGYDGLRHLVAVTNALGNVTRYNYCTCGALENMQDALNHYTYYYYDIAGRRVNIVYPDLTSITNNYNPLSQVTNKTDGAGISTTNWYTDQGLLYASSNAFGQVFVRWFDIEDRLTNSVDANGVGITNTYDNLARVLTRSYPGGGVERFGYSAFGLVAYTNQLTNVTLYGYDGARRKIAETNALSQVTQYAYDPAGDLTNLTDANNHSTGWGYDVYGRATNKVDATGTSILQYQYDADNRLTNRWSIAKTNTAYAYDNVGNLTGVTYYFNHALSFSYDAMNRMTSMSDGIGTTTFTYTPTGQLTSESGPWAGDTVSYAYSDRLRTALSLQEPNASAWVESYGYDLANRLHTITSPAGTFTYIYNPGLAGATSSSSLIANIALPSGAFITNTFDNNARMLGTWLYNSGASALDYAGYTYNQGNQRTVAIRGANNSVSNNYAYDPIGQVVGDNAYEQSNSAPRLNEQLSYVFDPAGNLNYRTNNGLIESFQVNSLNELTMNTNGGTLTVMGTTTSPATSVTVNGTNALHYGDSTFAATNMPLTTTYTAVAQDSYGRSATNTVTVSLCTNIAFQYDANGNLTNDGLRSFAYDDENQLTKVWVANQWLSQFTYDGKMRRRIREEFTWTGAAWVQTNAVYYVYDGNLVIQERDMNNLPLVTYTRGKDLSGSLQGAGGIGGLLARTDNTSLVTPPSFYHADGNGNITMLINSSQAIVAKYLYDAFGNMLSKSGSLADANVYRFSSKEWHANSGLVYYLYRYYDPNLQRWLNRDPLEEAGGQNLYQFTANAPVDFADTDGNAPILTQPPQFFWPTNPMVPFRVTNPPSGWWSIPDNTHQWNQLPPYPQKGPTNPSPPGTNNPCPPGTNNPAPPGTNNPAPPGTNNPAPPGTNNPAPPGTNNPASATPR